MVHINKLLVIDLWQVWLQTQRKKLRASKIDQYLSESGHLIYCGSELMKEVFIELFSELN